MPWPRQSRPHGAPRAFTARSIAHAAVERSKRTRNRHGRERADEFFTPSFFPIMRTSPSKFARVSQEQGEFRGEGRVKGFFVRHCWCGMRFPVRGPCKRVRVVERPVPVLRSSDFDPDVLVWDTRQRAMDYVNAIHVSANEVLSHTLLAGPVRGRRGPVRAGQRETNIRAKSLTRSASNSRPARIGPLRVGHFRRRHTGATPQTTVQ